MKSKKNLLLYFHGYPQAATVMDHLQSIPTYSQFQTEAVNVHKKEYMQTILSQDWQVVILHYTMFAMDLYYIDNALSKWLKAMNGKKVCFFQDEYFNCVKRFNFLNEYAVDCVYTLVEPRHFRDTYHKYTDVPMIRYTIPGYVSDGLLNMADRIQTENLKQDIDVSYRGRSIDYSWGVVGQEKRIIGERFKEMANGLNMDIEVTEDKRIYGDDWYRFIARSKAVLGVEAGVSIFDLEDKVRLGVEKLRKKNPAISNAELYDKVMAPWEDNIFYRTISPRHFEAAALGACQILFEGTYSGIMDPMIHYIPLKKDFSNIDQVLEMFRDDAFRQTIAENARRDLVDSGRYTYRQFVKSFDMDMKMLGLRLS